MLPEMTAEAAAVAPAAASRIAQPSLAQPARVAIWTGASSIRFEWIWQSAS